jgi:nitrite reductase [NAD(P)H] large subunit
VLDRGPWPLSRQLDEQAGGVLWEMVHDLGIEMMPSSEARRVLGDGDVAGIELLDGSTIEAELCLVSTGVRPNAELAHDAGLEITVGIAVDDTMQTSDTNVFAVGDVCDHRGHCYGLWPASVEQAQVAADRIVGRDVSFQLTTPPARLKVPGIDLLSIGDIHPLDDGVQTIVISDRGARRYRKLVLDEGRLTAAIVIGSPELFDDVTRAVEARLDLSAELERLEQGDWTFLSHAMEPATLER